MPNRRRGKMSFEDREIAVSMYLAGHTLREICERFGVTDMTIVQHVKRLGLPLRGMRRKGVWHEAFSERNADSMYWAGFVMADGSITKNRLTIAISDVDIEHVRAFKGFVQSEHTITIQAPSKGYANGRPTARISFASDGIISDLAAIGVTSTKSSPETKVPTATAANRDFWRGVVDGDGCFGVWGKKRPCFNFSLCGPHPLVEQFQNFAANFTFPARGGLVHHSEKVSYCQFTNRAAKRIVLALYDGCETALPRKMAIAREYAEA